MLGELADVVNREQVQLGVFLTLTPSTSPMQTEAIGAGFYVTPHHGPLPKLQLCTIVDLLARNKPVIPFVDPASLQRARPEAHAQQDLFCV